MFANLLQVDQVGNPQLLRRINRTRVLDALGDGRQWSRAELATEVGLAKPTVGMIIDDLVTDRLVRELGFGRAASRGGRRPVMIEIDPDAAAHVGIHFGVHTTRVAVTDAVGRLRATVVAASPLRSPKRSVTTATRLVASALEQACIPPERMRAIGAAVPGAVDSSTGVCTVAPNLGWRDVPIEAMLVDVFHVPAVARNIAHAAAAAEHAVGVAQSVDNLVWLYVGTGIGAGIINGGRLLTGSAGLSGEIGHCRVSANGPMCSCGRRGCLESLASGRALAIAAGTSDGADAFAEAAAGNRRAGRAVHDIAGWLAVGVATLVNVVDPALVVIGGGLAGAGEALLAPLREAASGTALREVPIVASALGDEAEVTGAVLLARRRSTETYRVERIGA